MRFPPAKLPLAAALAAAALGLSPGAAAPAPPTVDPAWATFSEAPDLGRRGAFAVGTRLDSVAVPARPGLAGIAPDSLRIRLFYPAAAAKGVRAHYSHELKPPRMAPVMVEEDGLAFDGAIPRQGATYPLIVMSHGLGGWSAHFSRLAEIVASHGYIVAVIDHDDGRYEDVPGFLAAFGNVLLRRSADQRAVMAALSDGATAKDLPIDRKRPFGLLGYSMGGYGALATAGARHAPAGAPFAALPVVAREGLAALTGKAAAGLGAVAVMAPWGGQPSSRAWSQEALAEVTVPLLMIGGSDDKVVDHAQGLRWLFDGLSGSDRYFLTLREAGHNIAGNARAVPSDAPPQIIDWFGDPVWRGERLNQVTSHFVVAFFDKTLKADAGSARYLAVTTEDSNRGEWPMPFGAQYDGKTAGDAQPNYWRGFHRGRAVGMTLEHRTGRR